MASGGARYWPAGVEPPRRPCGVNGCTSEIIKVIPPGPWPAACLSCLKKRRQASAAAYFQRTKKPSPGPKPSHAHACEHCGAEFMRIRKNHLTCSSRCQEALTGKVCSVDGCERPVRARGLCAVDWKRTYGKPQKPVWSDRARNEWHRRRARKAATSTGLPVLRADIAERDAWTCHLCGCSVDMLLRYPLRGSPTLDHVIPLARGGSHDPDNVKLAHWRCNSLKGAR